MKRKLIILALVIFVLVILISSLGNRDAVTETDSCGDSDESPEKIEEVEGIDEEPKQFEIEELRD